VSVRRQLLLALVPLVLALLATGAVSIVAVTRLAETTEDLLRQNYRSVLAAQRMKDAADRIEIAVVLRVAGWQAGAPSSVDEARREFRTELETQERTVYEPEERGPTARLRQEWPQFEAALDAVLQAPDRATARALYADRLVPALVAIREGADDLVVANQLGMARKNDRAHAAATNAGPLLLLVTALAGGLALVLSLGLLRRISQRIEFLIAAVERIDAGDFSTRVHLDGGDEIATLATRFDDLAAHLDDYRRSSTSELRQAQGAARATIDSVPDPVVVFGAKGYVLGVNRAAREILGLDDPERTRDPLASAPPEVTAVLAAARNFVLGEAAAPCRGLKDSLRVPTPNGTRDFVPRATPVFAADGRALGATVLLQDVTALRRLEDLRNELVATVAHELRTPLTSLRMAIELCAAARGLGARETQLLQAAQASCGRLQTTVDDLLNLARMQSGQLELRRRATPIGRLVAAAVSHAEAQAGERGVGLAVRAGDESLEVDVDPDRVQLAFSNLLGNAVRHSPPGGRVLLSIARRAGVVEVAVEDSGEGIPDEHRAHVFDKFYRVPGTSSEGAGLGLAIARGIVVAHGGEIGVAAGSGGGSRFWFTLPVASGAGDGPAAPATR
jgi:signal transduction histidine kinase